MSGPTTGGRSLGDLWNDTERRFPEDYSQLLDHTSYSLETLRNMAWVAQSIPSERRLLGAGVEYTKHQAVAVLAEDKQDEILQQAKDEGLTVAAVRKAVRLVKRSKISSGQAELKGRYQVILADPPWAYDDSGVIPGKTGKEAYGKAERHYPTMSVDEIAEMAVAAHARMDAVLFLWVPAPMLAECWPVIDGWGFVYKANLVWNKVLHNFGHYVSVRHEHLLLATRGSCPPDELTPMINSVQTFRRTAVHSAKPPEFRKIIERLYRGPFLELFARENAKGWTCHGNQLGAQVAQGLACGQGRGAGVTL